MSEDVTFTLAVAYGAHRLWLAAAVDEDPPYAPRTVWYVHFSDDDVEPWTHQVLPWRAVGGVRYQPRPDGGDWALVGLSSEGEVDFTFADHSVSEKILGAGLQGPDAKGWGYMSALQQIGEHLYACGGAGQVYKRLGPDQWVHMDDGLLQPPGTSERLLPRAIKGPDEQAIYVVGAVSREGLPPFAAFWNGQQWRLLTLPRVTERLTDLCVESPSRVWLCGANGTLLLGNAKDGFRSLSTVNDNQLFTSVHLFQGVAYLASNLGLFIYDPREHTSGIRPVVTGLQPELQDANVVDSAGGVLWSVGPKDIARFDGIRWTRVHHPDNARIGSP